MGMEVTKFVAAIVAGAIAGGSVSLLNLRSSDRNGAPPLPQSARSESAPGQPSPQSISELGELRQRVAQLENKTPPPAEPVDKGPPDQEAVAQPPDGETVRANHRALVDTVRRESVDSSWAPSAQRAIAKDLDALPSHRFELKNVECHTSSCVASLEWGSHGEAESEWRRVMQHPLSIDCASFIAVTPPGIAGGRATAELVLRCDDARADAIR